MSGRSLQAHLIFIFTSFFAPSVWALAPGVVDSKDIQQIVVSQNESSYVIQVDLVGRPSCVPQYHLYAYDFRSKNSAGHAIPFGRINSNFMDLILRNDCDLVAKPKPSTEPPENITLYFDLANEFGVNFTTPEVYFKSFIEWGLVISLQAAEGDGSAAKLKVLTNLTVNSFADEDLKVYPWTGHANAEPSSTLKP